MPIPSPFHSRTSQLCTSLYFKDWAGYYAVKSFDICHEPEYFAFRNSVGVIDVTPLFKYDVTGPDAGKFLDRIMVKAVSSLKPGRVTYLCWCDDDGKVVDDGTVTRLDENTFRVTAADPSMGWFTKFARGYQVEIEDISLKIASLAIQGPKSRDLLSAIAETDMNALKFFGAVKTKIAGIEGWITRTGYTGDLGYEVWVHAEDAPAVYDQVMQAGEPYRVLPCGLDALDVTRVEAGFIMNGVDYFSSIHCLTDERKSSPYELGLDWCVKLDREPFIGQAALARLKEQGSERLFVGLDVDWVETEEVFNQYGLPPEVHSHAWRDGKPVYDQSGEWIGQATSGSWSPILKKNLALAQVRAPFAKIGTKLKIEVTAEYRRHMVTATVVPTPFFDPPRKRS